LNKNKKITKYFLRLAKTGGMSMLISYFAMFFSLTGIILNIRKNILCWFCFMISDSLWFTYSIMTGQWAITLTHTVFVITNFIGFYSWSKAKHGKDANKNQ
jgi:nicotinamide riboside transporter PnuC